MLCLRCKYDNLASRHFCGACGAPLPVICRRCGFANTSADRYCGGCGNSVAGPNPDVPQSGSALTNQPEYRQLTVMFVDLVGSTELGSGLDPEDLVALLRRYREACVATIAKHDGFIAQYLGDGILVYFGFPQAQEDAAERAVRATTDLLRSDFSRECCSA